MSVEIIECLANDKSSELLNDLILSKDIALTEQEKIALANEFVDKEKLPLSIKFSFPLPKYARTRLMKHFKTFSGMSGMGIRISGNGKKL